MKLVVDERVKHRLIGIAVILSVAAIFAPAVMKKNSLRQKHFVTLDVKLPAKPAKPQVVAVDEAKLFKQIKVAHVDLSKEQSVLEKHEVKHPNIVLAKKKPITEPKSRLAPVVSSVSMSDASTHHSIPPKHQAIKKSKQRLVTSSIKKRVHKVKQNLNKKDLYSVQLASFSQKNNAVNLIKMLNRKGFKGTLSKSHTAKGDFYKVTVGHTAEREKANILKSNLAHSMKLNGIVIHKRVG